MKRSLIVFLHDVVMAAAAVVVAFYLRVGNATFGFYWHTVLMWGAVFALIAAATYRLLGLSRAVWRYTSVPELVLITTAVTLSIGSWLVAIFLVNRLAAIPRATPLILWFVLLVFLGGPRVVYRVLFHDRARRFGAVPRERRVPILLIGTGHEAAFFIQTISRDPSAPYQVVGLIDDGETGVGRLIHGVPVLGTTKDLARDVRALAAEGRKPERIIVTKPALAADKALMTALLGLSAELGLSVSRLPHLTEFREAVGAGRIDLRPIDLHDLLGRTQANLDMSAIADLVRGRRVVITGSGGTIGGELARQIAALEPAELVLVENSEFNLYSIDLALRESHPALSLRPVICDVRNRATVMRLFEETRPELVFHAAALKHVPMVELNPTEGVLTNVVGSINVADAAQACGARAFVQISTDKAVNPTSVMGATKRLAELYCQALDLASHLSSKAAASTRFMTVRFGNVLGSSGSVIPLFQRQLGRGGPITVTHPEIKRYFMTVQEAVGLVLRASAHGLSHPGQRGQIFVLDMGEPVRIVDVARQMIRLAGLKPDVDVKIEFVGLRPGEKLYEELFDEHEKVVSTEASGILAAIPRTMEFAFLKRGLDELAEAARNGNVDTVRRVIGQLVPGFLAGEPEVPESRSNALAPAVHSQSQI